MTNDQVPMTNEFPSSNDPLGLGVWSLIGHWCLVIGHSHVSCLRASCVYVRVPSQLDSPMARKPIVPIFATAEADPLYSGFRR